MKTKMNVAIWVLLFNVLAGSVLGYSGGDGSEAHPYEIFNKADLLQLAGTSTDYGKYFILTADIDLIAELFDAAVIAPGENNQDWTFNGPKFSGGFDGAGHVISNLTVNTNNQGKDFLGLFGYISSTGTVEDLTLENAAITGGNTTCNIGSLAGWNDGTIEDCHANASVAAGSDSYDGGGLVGWNQGTIRHCSARGTVTGGDYVTDFGGLVGGSFNGIIEDSYSASAVSGSGMSTDLGGLAGYNGQVSSVPPDAGTIRRCYATGNVTGHNYLGGLVGDNVNLNAIIENCYATGNVTGVGADTYIIGGLLGDNNRGTVRNCYSTGTVTSDVGVQYIGGLIGYDTPGQVTASFWDIQTSGMDTSPSGLGLPTATLMKSILYVSTGWDFDTVWNIVEDRTYPYLQWEDRDDTCGDISHPYPPGDANKDCIFNMVDLAIMFEHWLEDTRP